MAGSYRDLIAWQKAMALVTEVYRVTEDFPKREMYGLTRQVRDAAVSVPSNISEGKGVRRRRITSSFCIVHEPRFTRRKRSSRLEKT